MNSHEAYWYETLGNHALLFSYSGTWSPALFSQLQTTLSELLRPQLSPTQWRRVRLATTELGQNLLWYAPRCHTVPYAALSVHWETPHVVVRCANTIPAPDYPRLHTQLQNVHNATPAQLRAAYRAQLHAPPSIHSQGAGLGWLTIARLVSRPLEARFYPQDDHYLLCLTATI